MFGAAKEGRLDVAVVLPLIFKLQIEESTKANLCVKDVGEFIRFAM